MVFQEIRSSGPNIQFITPKKTNSTLYGGPSSIPTAVAENDNFHLKIRLGGGVFLRQISLESRII